MYRSRILILLLCLGLGQATSYGADDGVNMLIGDIERTDLQASPYMDWYQKYDTAYHVDAKATLKLSPMLKDIDVTIIMGTWCHDSQIQVPRFYKIMKSAGADMSRLNMVAVDMDFKAEGKDMAGLGITNTPTFIFYRQGVEVNRIVESPVESLEKDMLAILLGSDYRHAKYKE
jgi:thiol-disulfide isomerase/thioredoxin